MNRSYFIAEECSTGSTGCDINYYVPTGTTMAKTAGVKVLGYDTNDFEIIIVDTSRNVRRYTSTGGTWTTLANIGTIVGGDAVNAVPHTLTYDPDDKNKLICGATRGWVFWSNDNGVNWSGYRRLTSITAACFGAWRRGNTFFYAHSTALDAVSSDSGSTWTNVVSIPSNAVWDCLITTGGTILVIDNSNTGIRKSTDGGINWTTVVSSNYGHGTLGFGYDESNTNDSSLIYTVRFSAPISGMYRTSNLYSTTPTTVYYNATSNLVIRTEFNLMYPINSYSSNIGYIPLGIINGYFFVEDSTAGRIFIMDTSTHTFKNTVHEIFSNQKWVIDGNSDYQLFEVSPKPIGYALGVPRFLLVNENLIAGIYAGSALISRASGSYFGEQITFPASITTAVSVKKPCCIVKTL